MKRVLAPIFADGVTTTISFEKVDNKKWWEEVCKIKGYEV